MTYEIYRYIFIGGAILCAVMLILTIVLLIVLKIPKVINDLSGKTAKKAIAEIRRQNEMSGNKAHQPSQVNKERGKITDKISPSGKIIHNTTSNIGTMQTEKIATQNLTTSETNKLADETTVLSNENVVKSNETEILNLPMFAIEQEITFIHTNEIIK